ncbi:McrB family protein [Methylobacterium mesophilicum]|uniref:McrB family protein n=1 Tax=Methylobacterium mesophilicum TaxID=39956 RepID=UPI002F2C19B6
MAVMKVFAGPPGTGKTWRAAREAVRILRPGISDAQVQAVHQALVREGRIIWVTFHPSYSYEDFVEGYRPVETQTGNVIYKVAEGPFLRACSAASSAVSPNRFTVGQDLGPYRVTHVEAGGLVLESTAVRRRDRVAGVDDQPQQGFVDFWTLRKFAEHELSASDFRLHGGRNNRRKQVSRLTGLPTTEFTNASRHAAVYEALQQQGLPLTSTDVVLVIDEINRADLSRVFGELITLLEADKREGAPEERRIQLSYSGRPLSVPSTLSIVGTMNTADRSLSRMDLALRRRFDFVLVTPDPALVPDSYGSIDVRAWLTALNRRLAAISGTENLIGHADFMAVRLDELRSEEKLPRGDAGRVAAVAHVLRYRTLPFLDDALRGDRALVGFVMGRDLFIDDPLDELADELRALGRLEPEPVVMPAGWWDPKSPAWDADRFARLHPAAA